MSEINVWQRARQILRFIIERNAALNRMATVWCVLTSSSSVTSVEVDYSSESTLGKPIETKQLSCIYQSEVEKQGHPMILITASSLVGSLPRSGALLSPMKNSAVRTLFAVRFHLTAILASKRKVLKARGITKVSMFISKTETRNLCDLSDRGKN